MLKEYNIKTRIMEQKNTFFSDKKNVYMGAAVVLIPIIYEGLRFVPLEETMVPYTFPPTITIWLQNLLGTEGLIAYFASYYYIFPHFIILGGLVPMFFFAKKRPPWFYLSIALVAFIIDTICYIYYPVAPPVRLPNSGAVPIRLNLFPISDATITAYYSCLPSGHIFSSMLGVVIAFTEDWKWPKILYSLNTIIMTVVIVYLGDHYLIDSISSVAIILVLYFLNWKVFKILGWVKKDMK
ncbi:MAG: phosphatase PAP2 family protein [Candidatus Methanofastidiosia archaeon]